MDNASCPPENIDKALSHVKHNKVVAFGRWNNKDFQGILQRAVTTTHSCKNSAWTKSVGYYKQPQSPEVNELGNRNMEKRQTEDHCKLFHKVWIH